MVCILTNHKIMHFISDSFQLFFKSFYKKPVFFINMLFLNLAIHWEHLLIKYV